MPLLPGSQRVVIKWREPRGIGLRYVSPEVELGAPNVNAEIPSQPRQRSLDPPHWRTAPRPGGAVLEPARRGPADRAGARRVQLVPLRTVHWLLLGIGLTQVPLTASAIFVGWLLVLGWRARAPELPRIWFNLRQLILLGWTMAALVVLVTAIHGGLLGRPEMQIAGNNSFDHDLKWFSDRVADAAGARCRRPGRSRCRSRFTAWPCCCGRCGSPAPCCAGCASAMAR